MVTTAGGVGSLARKGTATMLQSRLVGFGLIALGVGVAAVSLLGPLAFGFIDWRIAANTETQLVGQDIVGLVLVAPVALAAGVLWLRRHRLAAALALGPALFSLYTFMSYVLSPDYHRYTGNNENAYPLLLTIIILSWVTAIAAWSAFDRTDQTRPSDPVRRSLGIAFLLIGGLFVVAWSGQITQVIAGTADLPEYLDDPGTFWVIKTFDLAFVMPIAIATGIGLLRNHALAVQVSYAVAGFFTLMSAAVSAMGIMMLLNDDPAATVILPAVTTPMTLVIGGLTVMLYRAYLGNGPSRARPPVASAVVEPT
jgi:hypothetical protein